MFNALVLDKGEDGKVTSSIKQLEDSDLPDGDVTVDVSYSTLNYKDGLVLEGLGGLVRNYPHVPGIDFSGTVAESKHGDFKAGDKVVLTGWRVGEAHWGGYSQRARVKGDWLVHLPKGLDEKQVMAIGTAGFTAMLAVMAIEAQGVKPDSGQVLVTGASGGVGSVACALLAKAGYEIAASTGRGGDDYLKSLGASEILERTELSEWNGKPLNKERWSAAVDSVGGTTLANVLSQLSYGGSAAAIGLAGGNKLDTTVIPFLLRGVNLLGIDSVMCPLEKRKTGWQRLAAELPMEHLQAMTSITPLSEMATKGGEILKGGVRGRMVVDVNG